MMVRLQITNQQKHANTVEQRRSALDSLLDFGDYMPSDPNKRFRGDGDDDDDEQQSKKKKLSSKHKKLKGKKVVVVDIMSIQSAYSRLESEKRIDHGKRRKNDDGDDVYSRFMVNLSTLQYDC